MVRFRAVICATNTAFAKFLREPYLERDVIRFWVIFV